MQQVSEYGRWRNSPPEVKLRDDGLPGQSPFDPPLERVPEIVREAIFELADVQEISIQLATVCVFGALSLAAAPFYTIELPIAFSPRIPIALYVIATAGTSERKSTSALIALRGVTRFQEEEDRRRVRALHEFSLARRKHERAKKRASRSKKTTDEQFAALDLEDPEPPLELTAFANSATKAGLRQAFAEGSGTLGLFAFEFRRIFGSSAQQFADLVDDLNSYFSGETNSQLQGGYAGRISMARASLSLFALGQAGTWDTVERPLVNMLRETGLTARILYVECPPYGRARKPPTGASVETPHINRFIERTYELLNENARVHKSIKFDSPASGLFGRYHQKIEAAKNSNWDAVDIADILSKSPEQAARLAGLMTRVTGADVVTAEIFGAATDLMNFFNCHSKRRYGDNALWSDDLADIQIGHAHITKYCMDRNTNYYPYRFWLQIAPKRIRDRARREMILGYLEAVGCITIRAVNGSKMVILARPAPLASSRPSGAVQSNGFEAGAVRPIYT